MLGLTLQQESRTEAAGRASRPPNPKSLDDLILGSDRIVYGTIHTKTDLSATQSPTGLPTRRIRIAVMEALKLPPAEAKELLLDYVLTDAPAVLEGESVLWYLDRTTNGLAAFFGEESGDFRRVSRDEDSPLFLNGAENKGLWGNIPKAKLWNGSTFNRQTAHDFLTDYFRRTDPVLFANTEALKDRKNEILEVGDEPCRPRAIPLETLLAATHARLKYRH